MSVLYIALPVALLIGALAVLAFVMAVKQGQFDDLDTPPMRMLFDDVDVRKDQNGDPAPQRSMDDSESEVPPAHDSESNT